MNCFSARYKQADYENINNLRGFKTGKEESDKFKLLGYRERIKIIELLKYSIEKEFFYPILYQYYTSGKIEISSAQVAAASKRLFGYDILELIDLNTLEPLNKQYYDQTLFDFIELLMLFILPTKSQDFSSRLQQIFEETSTPFIVRGNIIIAKTVGGLVSLAPLVKDKLLKEKLQKLVAASENDTDDVLVATVSAEIIQNVYSSEKKGKTKNTTEQLCAEVASKWVDESRAEELATLLSNTVKLAKNWNNNIADVRHTDKSTIYVTSPSIYKMIYGINDALIEFTISTLQDKYISDESSDTIITNYAKNWNVDLTKKMMIDDEKDRPIDLSEIPF